MSSVESSIEGICPGCAAFYRGEALNLRRNQWCLKCGQVLSIRTTKSPTFLKSAFCKGGETDIELDPEHPEKLRGYNLRLYLARN